LASTYIELADAHLGVTTRTTMFPILAGVHTKGNATSSYIEA